MQHRLGLRPSGGDDAAAADADAPRSPRPERPGGGGARRYRLVRRDAPLADAKRVSAPELYSLGGLLLLLLGIPAYAVATAAHGARASIVASLSGGLEGPTVEFLALLFASGGGGNAVLVPGWRTAWGDANRTTVVQVAVTDAVPVCAPRLALQPLAGPPEDDGVPGDAPTDRAGFLVCRDAGAGSLPALRAAGGAPPPGARAPPARRPCVVYSFSTAAEATSDALPAERAAARGGCEVHVFSPLVRGPDDAAPPALVARGSGLVVLGGGAGGGGGGSLTLHGVAAGAAAWAPPAGAPVTGAPTTWPRARLGDVMAALGHAGVSLLRVAGYGGGEWDALHDCFVADLARCGARVGALQAELTVERAGAGGLSAAGLAAALATLRGMTAEPAVGGAGLKQLAWAPERDAGHVVLGVPPARYAGDARLAAAFTSLGGVGLTDGRVAREVRTSWVARPLGDVLRAATDGRAATPEAYAALARARFCADATALAREQYGETATINAPGCEDASPGATPTPGAGGGGGA